MKIRFNTKYNTISAYVLIVFTLALLISTLLLKSSVYWAHIEKIFSVLAPVIWGMVIAYLLCPLLSFFEKHFSKLTGRKKPHPRLDRVVGIFVCVSLMLVVIVGIIYAVIPEIMGSIKNIFFYLPDYFSNLQTYLTDTFTGYIEKNPEAGDMLSSAFASIEESVLSAAEEFRPKVDSLLDKDGLLANVTSGALAFIIGLKDFCLGIIVSVYLLYSKEKFLAQAKKLFHAILARKRCEQLFRVANKANSTFMQFLSGKALDSLIIGMLCFIGLTIMKAPYVVLISVIVGITNMIPFFGPFIGAIPSGLLILLSQPEKTIPFAIFILALQQFDGNILGPKILGDTLGLSPFWIMFSVFLGGGLFGFIGMVIFVPLFALVYTMIKESVEETLEKKKLPIGSESYLPPGTRYHDDGDLIEVELDTTKS